MIKQAIVILSICLTINAFVTNPEWNVDFMTYDTWRERVSSGVANRSECVYFRNESIFGCVGNTYVECPATFNFTGLDETIFSKFGIGLESSEKSMLSSTENTHGYHLYPSLRSTTGYMSYFVELQGVSSTFCLTPEVDSTQFGFKITEPTCWGKIVNLFSTIPYTEVNLKSYLLEKPTVYVITDVYII